MKSLVLCPCGHDLSRHAERGCAGERAFVCACRLKPEEALEAAIRDARSDPLRWPFNVEGKTGTA